MFFGN